MENTYGNLSRFSRALQEGMLLLDGGMGTMLQRSGGFNGAAELLNVTEVERVVAVHHAYLDAGAEIITTNTFSANAVALADYHLSERAEELAFAGAQLARKAVEAYAKDGKPRFVAGSMGPTNRSLTVDAEGVRPSFEQMARAYYEQARGLIRGGVDVVLIETIFDVMNAKAAVVGAKRAMKELGASVDLWLSLTLASEGGRMLTGLHMDDFVRTMAYVRPTVISLNCGFGPKALLPYAERLAELFDGYVGIYPNAGLPDATGAYTLSPEDFAKELSPLLASGKIRIAGGCCGTTDAHIRALNEVKKLSRSEVSIHPTCTSESQNLSTSPLRLIGERCNVAGSRMFKTIVSEGRYVDAVALAVKQLDNGAWGIDVNVDAPMLDAKAEMLHLLKAFSSEARLMGVPIMIDSSNWEVVASALERVSGKAIVNSLTLKDGEEAFLRKARMVAEYGAGLVVMAADEEGQATTYERRIAVCQRAYQLLRNELDFPADDIIFDPNVLAICTGVAEHMNYAQDLLKTIGELRRRFPESHIIGGLSNLSFAFRGCDPMRRALHSVFLHHAQREGMDMVILSPAAISPIDEIPTELRTLLEAAVLYGTDVTQELMEQCEKLKTIGKAPQPEQKEQLTMTCQERLQEAILKGQSSSLEDDVNTLLQTTSPLDIISVHLMSAMERVGELFGKGDMFLPQVIRAAEMMNKVVAILQPHLSAPQTSNSALLSDEMLSAQHSTPTVVLATVKGDVHDIGKNICATLLRCNGYQVVDLGVMVEAPTIVEAVCKHQPAFVGLSGLITPSLGEMKFVVEALHEAQLPTPVLIGGATTSAEHTALYLATQSDAPVLWTSDASQLVLLAKKLYVDTEGETHLSPYVTQLRTEQQQLRMAHGEKPQLQKLADVRKSRVELY